MANRYYSTKYNGNKVITWKNFTDTSTPLSAANLQKSHQAIQEIDTGVNSAFEAVDNTKMDKSACAGMITQVDYTPGTGVFVFHYFDTSIPNLVIDTNLEKVAVNFTYNPETQSLEILQADGTTVEVDLSAFVANPDLVNSDTIAWTIHSDGSLEANVRNGSITDDMIEAHYLASIMSIAGQVENDKETADYYSRLAKSYAKGTSNLPDRPTESVDNASYYMIQSQGYSIVSGSYMNIAGNHASNAEAYAIGMRNGQPVYPPDPTYQNSSKYWAEQSHNTAVISGSYMNMSGYYSNQASQFAQEAQHSSIVSGSYMNISGSYMNMAQQYSERAGSYMNISASIMNVTGAYADDALDSARKSQSYATGDAVDDQGNPYRPGQETDNAKHYKELAEAAAQQAGALDFIGATSTTDGTHGLVPAAQAGDQDKALFGDGIWKDTPKAEMIANIEPLSTATHAYTVGQQFIFNGVLHIATAAITAGDTLEVGTNCAINQNITEQIKAIVDSYVTGIKGNAESSYRTGNVNVTPENIGAVPLSTNSGIGVMTGNGQYSWCLIARLTITTGYANGPIAFELSQRQEPVSLIQVCFASSSGTDPDLSYFTTNYSNRYYIKKADTSTWDLYANYTETWGAVALHRITGYCNGNSVAVTVKMENCSAPSSPTQVTYGGNVGYASSAGSATNATSATKLKDYTNGNDTWLDYGASALTTCSWVGAWNGYRMGAISPQNLRNKMGLGNTSGALPIANGGTDATTRLGAAKNLTNENVGTSATHFVTLTDSWGKFGYTSLANAKTALGLGAAAYKNVATGVANNSNLITAGGVYNAFNSLVNYFSPATYVTGGGTASFKGNINTINIYHGYFLSCTNACSGTKPNTAAEFLLIGRSQYKSGTYWGFQIAITLDNTSVYIRRAPYSTSSMSWTAWRAI